jgi:hypothetical protein
LATKFPVLLILDVYHRSQIPDPNFFHPGSQILDPNIFHPGSEMFPSRILDPGSASKNLSILTKNKWFLSSQKYDPSFPLRIRIPDLEPDFSPIPDPYPVCAKKTSPYILFKHYLSIFTVF